MKDADARVLLRDLFDAALAAARPATCLAPYIARLQPPKGKSIVIGAGKASAAMARAVEDQWPHPLEGLVVTRYGYGEACKKIEIVEAAHPVPDEKGRAAAGRILEKVKGLSRDDLVLCLISGGASALLALPAPGLTLAEGGLEVARVDAIDPPLESEHPPVGADLDHCVPNNDETVSRSKLTPAGADRERRTGSARRHRHAGGHSGRRCVAAGESNLRSAGRPRPTERHRTRRRISADHTYRIQLQRREPGGRRRRGCPIAARRRT